MCALCTQTHKEMLPILSVLPDSSFSSHHAESSGELNKAKSTIAKQSSEIASLTSEISRNQVQLSAQLKTLQGEKEANNELKLKVI